MYLIQDPGVIPLHNIDVEFWSMDSFDVTNSTSVGLQLIVAWIKIHFITSILKNAIIHWWRLDFSSSKCIFAEFTRDPRHSLVVQRLQRLINKLILFKNIIFLSPSARTLQFSSHSDAMTYGCATVFSIIFSLDDDS